MSFFLGLNYELAISQQKYPDSRHLGVGVFETFRARRTKDGYLILSFKQHLERLARGAALISSTAFDAGKIRPFVSGALKKVAPLLSGDLRVRIVLYKSDIELHIEPYVRRKDVLTLKSEVFERSLPEFKHSSALPGIVLQDTVRASGYDEALLVGRNGEVRESTWGNFFWESENGDLFTAPSGILPGVTRSIVLKLFPNIKFKEIRAEELKAGMSSAFVTRATDGILPVVRLDELPVEPSGIVRAVMERYEALFETTNDFLEIFDD
jgi:branched-subunit amino acid aminotransferase/4-amino-4-deoxychorismate lyase